MKRRCVWMSLALGIIAAGSLCVMAGRATAEPQNPMDPALAELGYIPLPDLGPGTYTRDGHTELGGLYPDGWTIRPPLWEALALEIARNQIQPLDAQGNPDPQGGKVVLMSAGMSNTVITFEGHAGDEYDCYRERAEKDPARNPQVVVVNGAQGTRAAMDWEPVDSTTYSTMVKNLAKYKVTAAQVQVVWVFHALRETGPFPTYAQELQRYLEATARNLKVHFPNVKLVYYTSRERAYLMHRKGEPDCYEAGFAIRWMIEKQMQGDPELNWDPAKGEVKAPLILWGPYFWCDGLKGRSDGLIWTCCEPTSDVYNNPHPESSGGQKLADQVYAFFKTDPTATPWYLRKIVTGQAPQVTAAADVTQGPAPLTVHFSAEASDPDGKVVEYVWTFGDGTFSYNPSGGPAGLGGEPYYHNPNPVKTFFCPGLYTAYLTATDDSGNAVTREVAITVEDAGPQDAYTYGAKFEPPVGRVVHGMGQWEQYNAKLMPLLPAELHPASKLIFVTLGDTPRGWRPETISATFQSFDRDGFIPHIDIALRGNQPTGAELAAMPDPLFGIDDEVASSSAFDSRIEDLARIIQEFGKPVIVRIGGEFNGPWNGYHPYHYDLADPVQADAAWQEWFQPFFAIIAERHEIKWFHLISYDWTQASYYAQNGWKNNDFTASSVILQKLMEELRKPQYLHTPDKALLNDYR